MLFNSVEFAIFLPVVFILYWFVFRKNLKLQNLLIVFVSYFFYGWWDIRFLALLVINNTIDYGLSLLIEKEKNPSRRRNWLLVSLGINLSLLGFFKYFNFFVDSFVHAFESIGVHLNPGTLNIVLPIGISFYTFQSLSYTIDVYRKHMHATRRMVDFLAFVSFFPQLVAGPIERASNLIPQFEKKRIFDYQIGMSGCVQILFGLFKKIAIADNCAPIVNEIFASSGQYSGAMLLMGAFLFAFQIYCDFSGYSDIAIGVAKLFGFSFHKNFAFPYFSRDIAEFWRRWHISLTTWFRDYLYIPLGGSKVSLSQNIRNVFIVFLISGLWHGANWTFVAWGLLNAMYFLPILIAQRNRKNLNEIAEKRLLPSPAEAFGITTTFILTCFAWIFFRSKDIQSAFDYIGGIFTQNFTGVGSTLNGFDNRLVFTLPLIALVVSIEWLNRNASFGLEKLPISKPLRYLFVLCILFITITFAGRQQEFIYFQF